MIPVCKICGTDFAIEDFYLSTPCGAVFHRNCMDLHRKKSEKCPGCEVNLLQSEIRSICFTYSSSEYARADVEKKSYENQINWLQREQIEKNNKIFDLEKKIESLNTSLDFKCKALADCCAQLKSTEAQLDSKTKDLTACEGLLREQEILTKNLYELVKNDLKKCSLVSTELENLRRDLASREACCAELEKAVDDYAEAAMKKTTFQQQFSKNIAAYEKENNAMQNRISELERMILESLSAKDHPVAVFERPAGTTRELNHGPDPGEPNRKRVRVSKDTKENVPVLQRVLRSRNRESVQQV